MANGHGGHRPGAGRKPKNWKTKPRPRFEDAQAFGLWALNAPDAEVTMGQKIDVMKVLASIELRQQPEVSKPREKKEAVKSAMAGLYATRQVRGLGVIDGGNRGA